LYYGGEIFFEILGDAGGSDQIRKSQSAVVLKLGLGLKVQRILGVGWLGDSSGVYASGKQHH
jgi:hypothetical protein